jgi:hypothetical protein
VWVNPQPLFWYARRTPAELYKAGSLSFDEPPGAVNVTVTLLVEGADIVIGTRPLTPLPMFAVDDVLLWVKVIPLASGVRFTLIESCVLIPPRFTITVCVPVMAA